MADPITQTQPQPLSPQPLSPPTWTGDVDESRSAALEYRHAVHAAWLDENDQKDLNAFYTEKKATLEGVDYRLFQLKQGDEDYLNLAKAVNEETGELKYPDINSFIIKPKKSKMVKTPAAGRTTGPTYGQKRLVWTPAVRAPLYNHQAENVYDGIEAGMFDLFAPKGHPRHLEDDWLELYATMAQARYGEDFVKHRHRNGIHQRIGQRLAGMGVDFEREKMRALIGNILPMPDAPGKGVGSPRLISNEGETPYYETGELESTRQNKIRSLMHLVGQGVEGFETAGMMGGVLLGGGAAYAALARKGLTTFIGTTNRHKVKAFLATGAAEVGIDVSWNREGYSMMLGALTGDDQNRVLSAMDAVLLGTAFNLAVDGWRALTGLSPKWANVELQKRVDAQTKRHLEIIARRAEVGFKAIPASEHVKHPTLLPKASPDAPLTPAAAASSDALVEVETGVWRQVHELDEAIKGLEKQLDPTSAGYFPPKNANLLRKKLFRFRKLKAAYEKDTTLLTLPEDMKAKQAAALEIDRTPSIQADDAVKAVERNLPEHGLLDVDAIDDLAGELPQGVSRSTVRQALKKFMETGELTGDDWNNMAVYLGFGSGVGGLTSVASDDDKKLAGFMMGFALPLGAGHRFKSWTVKALAPVAKKYMDYIPKSWLAKTAAKVFVPFNSQLKRLSKHVWMAEAQHEWMTGVQTYQRLERTYGFFAHLNDYVRREVITEAQKEELFWTLRNGARREVTDASTGKTTSELVAVQMMDDFDVLTGTPAVRGITRRYFEEYESVLREIGDEADAIGVINGKIKDYFPRSISPENYRRFLKDKGIASDSRIANAWKEEASALRRDLTVYEEVVIADQVIRTYGYTPKGGKPGFVKKRKFDVVPEELEKYYDSLEASTLKHVTQMTDHMNNAKFLGVGLTRDRLALIIDPIKKRGVTVENIELVERKIAEGALTKAEGEKLLSKFLEEEKARIKPSTFKLGGGTYVKPKTPAIEGRYDYKESIGDAMRELVKKGKLKPEAVNWVTELLHQRYATPNGRPMWRGLRAARDVSYMFAIGNWYSSMTQITDTALTASLNMRGWMDGTVWATAAKKLTGGKLTYTLADFGFDTKKMSFWMAELGDEAATTKWLRTNLRLVGFSAIDVFGKEVLLDSVYKQMRKYARSPIDSKEFNALRTEYAGAFGDDFDKFVSALKKGKQYDDNVMAAVYARMHEQHPASKSSMPMMYAKHPNGRVMYQLASFTLKQMDLLRKRSLDQLAEGIATNNDAMMKGAFQDMAKYVVLFGGGTMSVNSLKDFMLGRETEISDRGVNLLLNLGGMHRVHVERIRKMAMGDWRRLSPMERGFLGIAQTLKPPMISMAEDIYEDITDEDVRMTDYYGKRAKLLGFETPFREKWLPYPKAKSWRFLMGLGRDLHWSIGAGADWEEKYKKQLELRKPKAKLPKAKLPKAKLPKL